MTEKYSIRIREGIPITNYFIYGDERFPINFDLFKFSSKYFQNNKRELKRTEEIPLIDKDMEETIELNYDTIQLFINYVQRKVIHINDDNVISLNYLANIYEVTSLFNDTYDYMKKHKNLALQTLLFYQNRGNFDSTVYEKIMSKNLIEYINDERLMQLNFIILYRILDRYIKKNGCRNIIDFIFRVHEHYGIQASILFHSIDLNDLSEEQLNSLLSKKQKDFDFNFINLSLLKYLQSKIVEKEADIKSQQEKFESEKQQTEIDHEKKMKKLESQINNEKEEKNKSINENKQLKKQIKSNEEIIVKLTQDNKELKNKNDQLLNDKSQSNKDIENLEEIIKIQKFVPNEDCKLNGIFKYLTDKTGGNINENSVINVTSNSIFQDSYNPENLLCADEDMTYAAKEKDTDVFVAFDFKNMEIEISNYSIESSSCEKNSSHIKNWKIEISNDGNNWEVIDEHSNCSDLNEPSVIKIFNVKPSHFARYCRFHHEGEYWGMDKSMMEFSAIEFFGRLKTCQTF